MLLGAARRDWERIRPYARWLYYEMFPQRRPGYFKAAWNGPFYRLGGESLPTWPSSRSDRRVFLFFPLVDWHGRMQRSQHLATALAELGHLCIYVNPHLGLEYELPPLFSPEPRLSALAPGIFELHVHLPAEHAIDARLLSCGEAEQVAVAVHDVLSELNVTHAVQIVSVPSWHHVVTTLRSTKGFPIVYDCHDFLPGFERMAQDILDSEPPLFETCDHVLFSAQYLLDTVAASVPGIADKALVIHNANRPSDFAATERPALCPLSTVAYAGSLDHWFDVDLVATAAARNPSLTFKLAGRIEDNRVRRLERFRNICFLGEIPYSSVPTFLRSCDAAMIPFLRTPLTMSTNPIKMYEYFSVGLPVVSSRLPEVELYSHLVYIADSPEQFAGLIRQAVEERSSAARERRIAAGKAETWCHRASMLLQRVNESQKSLDARLGIDQWAARTSFAAESGSLQCASTKHCDLNRRGVFDEH